MGFSVLFFLYLFTATEATGASCVLEVVEVSGARLKAFEFSDEAPPQSRRILSYQYARESPGRDHRGRQRWVDVTIKYNLVAEYVASRAIDSEKGVLLSLEIRMPQEQGQFQLAGVDISPGAFGYFELTYLPSGPERLFLAQIQVLKGGFRTVFQWDGIGGAPDVLGVPIRPINLRDLVPTELKAVEGQFLFPFLHNDGMEDFYVPSHNPEPTSRETKESD